MSSLVHLPTAFVLISWPMLRNHFVIQRDDDWHWQSLAIRTRTYPCGLTSTAAWARCNASRLCRRSPRRRGTRCRRAAGPPPSSRRPPMPARNDTRPRSVPVESRRLPASPSNPATDPIASSTPRSRRGNSFDDENRSFYCHRFLIFIWTRQPRRRWLSQGINRVSRLCYFSFGSRYIRDLIKSVFPPNYHMESLLSSSMTFPSSFTK